MYSSGKSIAAIMMAIMRDQGNLEYTAPVCKYWPEFAQNGKENILVEDVLRHDARLWFLSKQISQKDTLVENIKQNAIGKIIEEDAPQELPYGVKRVYHAMSKDLIANEIFRRVESSGRTMGEYFREEIMEQHGLNIYLNMEKSELHKVYDNAVPNTTT